MKTWSDATSCSQIWVYTVCWGLSVPMFRDFTVSVPGTMENMNTEIVVKMKSYKVKYIPQVHSICLWRTKSLPDFIDVLAGLTMINVLNFEHFILYFLQLNFFLFRFFLKHFMEWSSLIWVCTVCMSFYYRNIGVQNFRIFTVFAVYVSDNVGFLIVHLLTVLRCTDIHPRKFTLTRKYLPPFPKGANS